MNKKLESQYVQLEDTRIQLLKSLEKIEVQKLNSSPAPGKWSVAQILYHINRAESQSVLYVSKKRLDVNNLKRTGLWEAFKLWVVKVAFVLPFKYKAPVNVLGDVPDNVSYKEITIQWNETREKMKDLLSALPEDMLGKNVFKQPAAGRLNIYQMLDFMQSHLNRHIKQINSALKG